MQDIEQIGDRQLRFNRARLEYCSVNAGLAKEAEQKFSRISLFQIQPPWQTELQPRDEQQ